MTTQKTDLELISQIVERNQSAFEELLERYSTKVMNMALRVTRNQEDAEEVLQDVFITIFKKASSFESRSAFSSWLYRVTMNAAFMKIRSRNRRRTVSIEDLDPEFQESLSNSDQNHYEIERLSTSHETRALLQKAVDKLPQDYRAIFILRDVDGLSNQAASSILGISVPAVKSRLHRARVFLREELGCYWRTGELDLAPGEASLVM